MSWTEDRVERLKQLWNDGMSASQIAKQLGEVTRNAVIGKVHRLGLSHRGSGSGEAAPAEEAQSEPEPSGAPPADPPKPEETRQDAKPPAVADASQPRPPGQPTREEEEARATLAEIEKMARRLDLLELTERTCKWPIGDPSQEGFHFCGLPAETGKPYCRHHVPVAYQPMSTRRDRSRAGK